MQLQNYQKPAEIKVEVETKSKYSIAHNYDEAGEISIPESVKSKIVSKIGQLKLQGSEILEKAECKTGTVTITEIDEEGKTTGESTTYDFEFAAAQ